MGSCASARRPDARKKITASALIPRGGAALDARLRERFASRLGIDFSRVRVHSDSAADAMARAVDAQAYTLGNHIVFRTGRFRPDSPDGEKLLVHELSHVAQQGTESPSLNRAPKISNPHDAAEREADSIANHFDSRPADPVRPVSQAGSGPLLHRVPMGSNAWGKFDLEQVPMSAAAAGDRYYYRVKITFEPDPATVDSPEIAFVQALNVSDAAGAWALPATSGVSKRLSGKEWSVDSVTPEGFPFVGYGRAGKPYKAARPEELGDRYVVEPGSSPKPLKNAVTRDWPTWTIPNLDWSFNTAAVAKSGPDLGQVYGTITWGFNVDGANKVGAHNAKFHDVPGPAWKGAVEAWNKQAKGPVANRVAPDQQALPKFK